MALRPRAQEALNNKAFGFDQENPDAPPDPFAPQSPWGMGDTGQPQNGFDGGPLGPDVFQPQGGGSGDFGYDPTMGGILPPTPVGGDLGPPVETPVQPGWGGGGEQLGPDFNPQAGDLGPPIDEGPIGIVPTGGLGPELGPPVQDTSVSSPDIQTAFHDALLKQLTAGPATAQSVLESPAAQAHRLASQRGMERQRADNAETAAQNGTLGGLEGVNRGLDFATAEGDAGYTGDLAQTQETARQNALMQALGLTQNGTQANNQLGFNYSQLGLDANYKALLLALQQSGVA